MTTFTQTTMRQDEERAHLLCEIARLQGELARVRAEIARARVRLFATNRHTFTLTFAGGQVALLEVRGAADQEEARTIAQNAITTSRYTVTDGDTTGGRAHYFYCWCSAEAQTEAREKKHADAVKQSLPQ